MGWLIEVGVAGAEGGEGVEPVQGIWEEEGEEELDVDREGTEE